MIELKYYLSPKAIKWSTEGRDLKNGDELTFTNNVFRVEQTLIINGSDLSIPSIRLVWFVWEMTRGIADLADGASDFYFWDTEGSSVIFFKRIDDLVRVTANYTEANASISLEELQSALRAYAERVWKELCEQFPDLKENAWLAGHYPSPAGWVDSCGKVHRALPLAGDGSC